MTPLRPKPRILIVGKDARTDAIATACRASPQRPELYALAEMRIPGLVEKCEQVFLGSLTDTAPLTRVAKEVRPDLVIIGPEEPLAAGYVDALQALGVPAFGPSQKLAAIESSKAWARRLLDSHDIPGNPDYRVFESSDGLRSYMDELGTFVVKPDGLTAGKGVRVWGDHFHTVDEAIEYAEIVLAQDGLVQIEQKLEGEEFSLQTITDGESVIHCPLVQDHKRAFEGDKGPNTGGMGSYSCADGSLPFLTDDDVAEAHAISERVIDAIARDTGEPYRGVLYGGFMATRDGTRLVEYNSRFGDPEAMNVLPILDADFVELCSAVTTGNLSRVSYSFAHKATVCKYVVPRAYPDPTASSEPVEVDVQNDDASLHWYWAACKEEDGQVLMTSSRAGAFVGVAESLSEAEAIAEKAASSMGGQVRHRPDIGRSEVVDARVRHMQALRTQPTARIGANR